MTVKAFGMLILFLSFSLFGFYRYRASYRDAGIRRGILELLFHMKLRLSASCAPLSQIYAEFENDRLSSCGFLDRIKRGDPDALYHALENEAVKSALSGLYPIVVSFASGLGRCPDTSCVLLDVEKTYDEYSSALSELEKSSSKRALLELRLSVIAGVFAAVIFI